MGIVEKWNNLAKKKIYINETLEIGVGRLAYMIILNFFIMMGMILSGTTPVSLVWLWVDMLGSFKRKEKT
jgi:hypothetical protein